MYSNSAYPPEGSERTGLLAANDALLYKNHEYILSKIKLDEPFSIESFSMNDFGILKSYNSSTYKSSFNGYDALFDMVYWVYSPSQQKVRKTNLRILFPESQVVFYKDNVGMGWVYWRQGVIGFNQEINPKLYHDNFTKDDLAFVLKNIDIFQ